MTTTWLVRKAEMTIPDAITDLVKQFGEAYRREIQETLRFYDGVLGSLGREAGIVAGTFSAKGNSYIIVEDWFGGATLTGEVIRNNPAFILGFLRSRTVREAIENNLDWGRVADLYKQELHDSAEEVVLEMYSQSLDEGVLPYDIEVMGKFLMETGNILLLIKTLEKMSDITKHDKNFSQLLVTTAITDKILQRIDSIEETGYSPQQEGLTQAEEDDLDDFIRELESFDENKYIEEEIRHYQDSSSEDIDYLLPDSDEELLAIAVEHDLLRLAAFSDEIMEKYANAWPNILAKGQTLYGVTDKGYVYVETHGSLGEERKFVPDEQLPQTMPFKFKERV